MRLRWLGSAVGIAVVLVLGFAMLYPTVTRWNLALQDWILRQTSVDLPDEFVLVGIDEPSLNLSGVEPEEIAESQALQLMKAGFPWSREVYAHLITRLMDAGAKLVVLDLVFPGPRDGDDALAEVLKKYQGRVVMGCNFDVSEKGAGRSTMDFFPPTPALAEAAGDNVGFVNFSAHSPLETDSITRYFFSHGSGDSFRGVLPAEGDTILPAMMTVAAQRLGKDEPVELHPRRFRYSQPETVPVVPLYWVFLKPTWEKNLKSGAFFKDKVVLLGAMSEQQKDFLITPFGRMPGPEVQLHALAALLRNDWIFSAGSGFMLATIPVAGLLVLVLILRRRSALWFAFTIGVGVLVWLGLCAGVFLMTSYFLPLAPPLMAWLVSGFAALACDVSLERRERGRMRSMLERYVSRDAVHEIVENQGSFLQTLEGQRKDVVILFSDLKGFTADSERLDASELVTMLNEYFGEMVEVVFLHDGTIDKFMGDALMATWGCIRAHGPKIDAQNAVRAAFEMKERLKGINARRNDDLAPWGSGIGICQGPAIFGNIGSQQKMDMTVIGDTVNLASRMEGLTRMYGCSILINEEMAENIRGECEVLLVDEVRVKGKQKPAKIYYPHREKDAEWSEAFVAARGLYVVGDFGGAAQAFAALTESGLAPELARSYRQRCEELAVEPPEEWTGIWTFREK